MAGAIKNAVCSENETQGPETPLTANACCKVLTVQPVYGKAE